MALTKASAAVFPSASVAAGLTKATAVFSPWINTQTYYRMCVRWTLTNNAAAPGAAPVLLAQTSPDNGTTVYDEYPVGGDIQPSSVNSGEITVDDTTMYIRVGVYGHTTNAVTAQATIQAITGL